MSVGVFLLARVARLLFTASQTANSMRLYDNSASFLFDAFDRYFICHLGVGGHAVALAFLGADYGRASAQTETGRLVELSANFRCQRLQSTFANKQSERPEPAFSLELSGS